MMRAPNHIFRISVVHLGRRTAQPLDDSGPTTRMGQLFRQGRVL